MRTSRIEFCASRLASRSRDPRESQGHRQGRPQGGRRERPNRLANLACRRSSHGGDAIDLDVSHRTLALSANHFFALDDRRLRGDALEAVLGDGAAAATLPADAPEHEAEDAEDGDDREAGEPKVKRGQSQEDAAVRERLVVSGRAVVHAVAPEGRVDAGVQLGAALLAIPGKLEAGEGRCRRWSAEVSGRVRYSVSFLRKGLESLYTTGRFWTRVSTEM